MIVNELQINILKEFNIDVNKFDDVDKLLETIDDVMIGNYLDEDDEPMDEFHILQKIYDNIVSNNPIK